MWPNWVVQKFSDKKLLKLVREKGSLVGERMSNGRRFFIYLLNDFFVQVLYKKDDPVEEIEQLNTFQSVEELNSHMEKEFRASF